MPDVAIRAVATDDPCWDRMPDVVRAYLEDLKAFGLPFEIADEPVGRMIRYMRGVAMKSGMVFIAEGNGGIAGFGWGTLRMQPALLEKAKRGCVNDLYVAPPWRGSGLGERLFRLVDDWLIGKGVDVIEFEALTDNSSAQVIWERRGYRDTFRTMRKEITRSTIDTADASE
jgi:GNAT superfamily N-acetyltransferase